MSRVLFLVNDALAVGAHQTTAALIAAAVAEGWPTFVFAIDGLALDDERGVVARVQAMPAAARDARAVCAALASGPTREVALVAPDLVWCRSNPAMAKPATHRFAFELLQIANRRGVRVVNRPHALLRASGKVLTACLPAEFRPRTLIATGRDALVDFVRGEAGAVVLKPHDGSHGRDVYLIQPQDETNLVQIIDSLRRQGPVVAQSFVPAAREGDVRVWLVCGELFRSGDLIPAARRVPASGAFRSNTDAGGRVVAAQVPAELIPRLERLAVLLYAEGVDLAGLDMAGDLVLEVNVFSPGGLTDMESLLARSLCGPLVTRVLTGDAGCWTDVSKR